MTSDITLPYIDPNLIVIAVAAAMILGTLLLLFYIPSIEDFRKLEEEKKGYKLQRDYYINQWCIEMISHGKTKEEVEIIMSDSEQKLEKEQLRSKRARKNTLIFARLADKLRGVNHA